MTALRFRTSISNVLHTISRKINVLMLILFLLLVFDGVLVYRYIIRSNQDTLIVNKLGQIRGSIQQYVKRELSANASPEIEERIDRLFAETKALLAEKLRTSDDLSVEELHEQLEREYRALNELITRFRDEADTELYNQVFNQSEKVYTISNATVLSAQIFFERMRKSLYYHLAGITATVFVIAVLFSIVKRAVRDKLEYDAHFDTMSGALNKKTFLTELERRVEELNRYDTRFALLILDIDKFKQINDTYGHQKGDEALINLSTLVRESIRTTVQRAAIIPEQRITVSIGISGFRFNTAEELLKQADKALYRAKERGRNRSETEQTG